MEFEKMTIEDLEQRKAEIAEAVDVEDADLDALEAEARAINEELENRKAAEAKKVEIRKAVANGAGEVIAKPEEEEKRANTMDKYEIRKSPEYLDAWVEYQKGRATEEQRALLTTNAEDGTIAVPVYVEDTIHTAWENDEIMRRVRKSFYKGNLKVGYEQSASAAQFHEEGGEPITEEDLVVGYVEMIPVMVKKMVRYSDEVLDIRGQAFVDYIFDEIEYQIVKMAASNVVSAIVNSNLKQTQALAGSTLATVDIINAQGKLGGEATNPVVLTTRANAAALKAAALSANYAYDPFDGLEVLYVDSAAMTNINAIVVDLSGVQANFPDGEQVKFKFDDLTEAAADMIRVIGRLYVAIALVAPGKAVVIPSK